MPAYELLLNGASIPFYECVVEKQEKRALDKCLFKVKRSQSVSLAADVKFRKSGATPVYLFGGKVVEVNEEYDGKTCTAFSYAKTLDEQRVFPSKLYTSKSPEFIARDLIASYTSLTWASSWSSGVTLNVYEAVGTVGENIRRLAQMAGADYWTFVDSAGVAKIKFEPASLTNLGVTLNLGGVSGNARRLEYESGEAEIVNAAEVYGKTNTITQRYIWNSTYSGFGLINFVNPAQSVYVRVRGVDLASGADYVYEPQVPRILFNSNISGTSTNPVDVEVGQSIDSTPMVYAENTASISLWGRRAKAYVFENLVKETDLQNIASKIVSAFGDPRKVLKVLIPGVRTDIRDGGYVTVNDPYLGLSNASFVVRKVVYRYPPGETEVELGQFRPEIYDFERQVGPLVETAGRSSLLATSKRRELKLYFSGTTTPSLVTQLGNSASGSAAGPLTNASQIWFTLDLQIVGQNTVNLTRVGHLMVTNTGGAKKIFYGSPISHNGMMADAGGNVTVSAVIYAETNYLGTRYLVAPASGSFSITLNGIKRLLPTTLGWSLMASYDTTTGESYVYWGQSNTFQTTYGSHIFNVGVEYP